MNVIIYNKLLKPFWAKHFLNAPVKEGFPRDATRFSKLFILLGFSCLFIAFLLRKTNHRKYLLRFTSLVSIILTSLWTTKFYMISYDEYEFIPGIELFGAFFLSLVLIFSN